MKDKNYFVSVVVPLFEEAENVQELHKKIVVALTKWGKPFEIIFVDDGSFDATSKICRELSPLTLIRFRKNAGQTAAFDAGIHSAKGEYIVTMDGDLQNDPEDIPRLFHHLEKNSLDVVSGWRVYRKDPFLKRFFSRGAHFLRHILLRDGIHDSGCSLKIYKRECFEGLRLYGEIHRFIPALLKMRGFRIGELPVSHYPRKNGQTKYNWKRAFKGLLDMFVVWFWQKYFRRPLHFLGGVGLLLWFFGFLCLLFILFLKISQGNDLSDNALTTLALFCFFFGLQFLFLGVLFDAIIKIYYSRSEETPYFIAERRENEKEEDVNH
ncbi:glycosyltransferase family 2 protein [Candidatus Peregrinibacteria bacterium]|nr:MAG: glycosyltransferase family 2 protein [Candidatus Peregrinibacteria bacterium]